MLWGRAEAFPQSPWILEILKVLAKADKWLSEGHWGMATWVSGNYAESGLWGDSMTGKGSQVEKPVTAKIPGKMTSGIPSRRTVRKSPSIWVQQGSRPFFQGPHPAAGWCLLRSAVVHLLVWTYWPYEESLKLSLLVLHRLASWRLSGGRGAQREWELKDKDGANPLPAYP